MLSVAKYVSSQGTTIDLDTRTLSIGTAASLRSNYWSYDVDYRSVSGVVRKASEINLDCLFSDPETADLLRDVSDYDLENKTPGKIWAGDWWQRAYITSQEVGDVFYDFHSETLTVVLLDGVWSKWHSQIFHVSQDTAGSDYLDLPTDVLFDLLPTPGQRSFTNEAATKSPVKITIYGHAINPYVIIGDNRYEVDVTIPDGSRLEIDGTVYPKTITLISPTGDESNVFEYGIRGTGEGSGEYIFQPLQPGYQTVTWSGSFMFELEWLEQIGMPPFLRSSLIGG